MNNLTFYFRINSDVKNGIGHSKRCVRIAHMLKENGYQCFFLIDNKSNIEIFLKGFKIFYIYDSFSKFVDQEKDAKLVLKKIKHTKSVIVLDDYRFDCKWEKIISKENFKVIVLDDSGLKNHYCDVYINYKPDLIHSENFNSSIIKKKETKLLLGPEYAIIDCKQRIKINKKDNIFKICFYMGGSGDFKYFDKIILSFINLVSNLKMKFEFSIIYGVGCKNIKQLILLSKKFKFIKIIDGKKNLDKKISSMDLIIGSAGNIVYEASYYNIPSIFFEISKNQNNKISNMEKIGHYFILSKLDLKNFQKIAYLIFLIFKNYNRIYYLVINKKISIDNEGVKRIVNNILHYKKNFINKNKINKNKINKNINSDKVFFKRVKDDEINQYLHSRNLLVNRKVSISTKKINRLDHYTWWFITKRNSYVMTINNFKIVYLYDETIKLKNKNYSLQGWFACGNDLGIREILTALNWHQKYMRKKKNIDLSFGIIKKGNKINFSKYLNWRPIQKDSQEHGILKKICKIDKKYNYYSRY